MPLTNFCQGDYAYELHEEFGVRLWRVFHIPDGKITYYRSGRIDRQDCIIATIMADDPVIQRIAFLLSLTDDELAPVREARR